MAEYVIRVDRFDDRDDLPRWMYREVYDHHRRYDCDGHVFVDGFWGGLVCTRCGR
jgi:hypothetical protein